MAGLGASRGGGGRGRRRARRGRLAEINVTPFVDVMLVLLIVFMVTAPLLTVSIPIELPQTDAKQSSADNEPLAITVQSDGTVYLQETVVTVEELVPRLRAISNEGYDRPIWIRGDRNVDYGVMADVLARVSSGGFTKIQLETDARQGNGGGGG
ncbi:MAG: biopolymer transporter ExbD [Hyphomonadaceae bacterium]|jgi:biopolymer transport protein TolR|nr:biopolymer transporter ExbD [Hyphomonadaceae bacterium]